MEGNSEPVVVNNGKKLSMARQKKSEFFFLPSTVRRSSEFFGRFSFSFLYRGFFWPCTSKKLRYKISGSCQTIFIFIPPGDVCWFVHVVSLTLSPPLRGT